MNILVSHGHPYPEGIEYHPDENDCVSGAFAYLMFRQEAPERLWQPAAIDEITNREPGQRSYDEASGILALMEYGARVTNVHAFDNERFIEQGLPYLEEYYADHWLRDNPPSFYAYWTPERIALQQQFTSRLLEDAKHYGDQWNVIAENPTMDTIHSLPKPDTSIFIHTTGSEPNAYHALVILGSIASEGAEGDIIAFDNTRKPPIGTVDEVEFRSRLFHPEWGLLVVEKPTV